MGLTVNYWLVVSDAFKAEIEGVLSESVFAPPLAATSFPELNTLPLVLRRSLLQAPAKGVVNFSQVPGTSVWSGYAHVGYLGNLVPTREFLQDLEEKYYPDFYVAGMWDYSTGDPIGGVGSPWFVTPVELTPVLGGAVKDINLNAGQVPRNFV